VRVDKPRPTSDFALEEDDTIVIDGKKMVKPFVEKPVSGENHNVNIYFPKAKGGGARRLFRKVRLALPSLCAPLKRSALTSPSLARRSATSRRRTSPT